jgi:p-hydroxybenzoate 3-monooxygenase
MPYDCLSSSESCTNWRRGGAKGLTGDESGLDAYSETCLRRVWRAEHFSYWMTTMLHRISDDPFDLKLQLSQLRWVTTSEAAARSLAENYVGLAIA